MKLRELYDSYAAGRLDKPGFIEAMHEKHRALFDYSDYLKGSEIDSITIGAGQLFVTVKGSGIKLLVDREDKRFIPIELLNFRSIDARERSLLAAIMPPRATVFDVGANIGWYTLNFAKLPGVKKVYAFEPVPYTYGYLVKHLRMNDLPPGKVEAFNHGFSDRPGAVNFFWTKSETGSASLRNIQDRPEISQVTCRLTTMDKFVKQRRAAPDLIKCDTEGSELFVFKGAAETLKRHRPIIYTEMLRKWSAKFGYHPNDIIDLLAAAGYRCFGFVDDALAEIDRVTPELATTNYFFLHGAKHRAIIKKLNRS